MNENERNGAKTPSLTKEARIFNQMEIRSTIQGMKAAAYMDRQVTVENMKETEGKKQARNETPIPTGADIREALQEGENREIIQEDMQELREER